MYQLNYTVNKLTKDNLVEELKFLYFKRDRVSTLNIGADILWIQNSMPKLKQQKSKTISYNINDF